MSKRRRQPVRTASLWHQFSGMSLIWAKSKGVVVHDFCGSPLSDQIKNPDHPYCRFDRFKTSFGKTVVDFVGAYDIILRPYRYRLWSNFGERIAPHLYA